VGVEILDEAQDLPGFPHPLRAAYVLGPERGALSPELAARCKHLVRIPAAFSLNLATAGAIVMYDRLRSHGRFGSRPVAEHAVPEPAVAHVQGAPKKRRVDRALLSKDNRRLIFASAHASGTGKCIESFELLASLRR
jgi:hypothetical protein